MVLSLTPIFALYILTPGRRIYVLRRVREIAAKQELATVLEFCDKGIAQDREALDLDAARRDPSAPTRVRDKDQVVDRTLVAADNVLDFHISVERDESAVKMRSMLFPSGVGHHTQLPHFEQSAANERVLGILESDEHAAWVQAYDLTRVSKSLRKAHDAFDAALKSRDDFNQTSWDEVKAARARGQELYLETVVQILAPFPGDPAARDVLLQPIWQQEDAVRAFRRQRRGGLLDVDPESGEIIEPPEADEPAANDEQPG